MQNSARLPYLGLALFSYGFRPNFLAAGCFAVVIVPIWMAVWSDTITLHGPFSPMDWHIHEMLFGYTSAVIAGFLFTAIPNWTGRMPMRGWPLVALTTLWLVGRLAVAGMLSLEPLAVMAVDCGFMAAIGMIVAVEIIAGRNWKNLTVILPVLIYLAANVTFHLEAATKGNADFGRRLGFAMVVMLIGLIGGRIIPSFTRNWLAKRGPILGTLPAPFGRFDAASLLITLIALLIWVAQPKGSVPGTAMLSAGALQAVRLVRWCGWRVWSDPLVAMMHLAFAFVPAGLAALGLASLGVLSAAAGFHLLGIGAFGGMTLAVMMRASLGHTGRELRTGPALTLAFMAVVLAAVMRITVVMPVGLWVAAGLWSAGFGIFVWKFVPALTRPNVARRQATSRQKPAAGG